MSFFTTTVPVNLKKDNFNQLNQNLKLILFKVILIFELVGSRTIKNFIP